MGGIMQMTTLDLLIRCAYGRKLLVCNPKVEVFLLCSLFFHLLSIGTAMVFDRICSGDFDQSVQGVVTSPRSSITA